MKVPVFPHIVIILIISLSEGGKYCPIFIFMSKTKKQLTFEILIINWWVMINFTWYFSIAAFINT